MVAIAEKVTIEEVYRIRVCIQKSEVKRGWNIFGHTIVQIIGAVMFRRQSQKWPRNHRETPTNVLSASDKKAWGGDDVIYYLQLVFERGVGVGMELLSECNSTQKYYNLSMIVT